MLQVIVGVPKEGASQNALARLLQGSGVGSLSQYWPGGTVTPGYRGSNKQPPLWWTPNHRTLKAVCNGHRSSPVPTVRLFSSEKVPFSSSCNIPSNLLILPLCYSTAQIVFSLFISQFYISSSLCESSRRMGRCLIIWQTRQRLQVGKGNSDKVGLVTKAKGNKPGEASVEDEGSFAKPAEA